MVDLKTGTNAWVCRYDAVSSGHVIAISGEDVVIRLDGEIRLYQRSDVFTEKSMALLELADRAKKNAAEALKKLIEANACFEKHTLLQRACLREAHSILRT